MKQHKLKVSNNQEGFASIMIALVLVLVLSLITVGFAQLMNRETRQALDKQLSSQAYYAAESGVNIASDQLKTDPTTTKNNCANTAPFANNLVGNGSGATISCLLIDPAPRSLEYHPKTSGSKTFDIRTDTPVGAITISWQDEDSGNTTFATAPGVTDCLTLPSRSNWKNSAAAGSPGITGILRAQLIPKPTTTPFSRQQLIDSQFTGYLCPNNQNGNIVTYGATNGVGINGGSLVDGKCKTTNTTPRYCYVTINGLNNTGFVMNLRSIYSQSSVVITACTDPALTVCLTSDTGNILRIKDAQALVDSTGKAQDVLRRVQARIPYDTGNDIPDGTSVMSDLCKQLAVYPGSAESATPIDCPEVP